MGTQVLHRPPGLTAPARAGAAAKPATAIESHRVVSALITLAMAVCGFALWTALPAGVLWLVPTMVNSDVPVAVSFLAVAAAMAAFGLTLVFLDRLYCRVNEGSAGGFPCVAWRRPLSNSEEGRRPVLPLERVMTVSAVAAVLTLVAWFFVSAHCGAACSP